MSSTQRSCPSVGKLSIVTPGGSDTKSEMTRILRANEIVKFENGLTTPRPASSHGWHHRVNPVNLWISSDMMTADPTCVYRANEPDALIARHKGDWEDDDDSESTTDQVDEDEDAEEWEIDQDMPWQYAKSGELSNQRMYPAMAPVVEAMTNEVERVNHEREMSMQDTTPEPHVIITIDMEGSATLRKSTIKFNPTIVVHGEIASSSSMVRDDIYNSNVSNLSTGSFRHKIREMERDDETWYQRALDTDVEEARRRAARRGCPNARQMERIEVYAYEKAVGQSETVQLQASADKVLDAKVDWTSERRKAFDTVLALAEIDDQNRPEVENPKTTVPRLEKWTGSLTGTIRKIKRSAPPIPTFAELVAPMPHKPLR